MNSFQIKSSGSIYGKGDPRAGSGTHQYSQYLGGGVVGLLRPEVQEFKDSLVYIAQKREIQLLVVVFEAMLRAGNSRPRANFSLFCRLLL